MFSNMETYVDMFVVWQFPQKILQTRKEKIVSLILKEKTESEKTGEYFSYIVSASYQIFFTEWRIQVFPN